MSNIAIKVENLGKKYVIDHYIEGDLRNSFGQNLRRILRKGIGNSSEEFWALKEISFEILKGEAVGVIGRNGAGKSTLLKILSRITDPSTGRFEINGRVSSLLEVGTGFHMELTGRENIYLNGTILGMKRAEIRSKFDQIIAFSGVERFIDTPVKHYSSGMKVRLAFSVAAHLEPEIMIIDEVLAVGDAEFQKKCLGKMDEVSKREGRTVLFVSHNLSLVESLCSNSMLLDFGMLTSFQNTSDIVKQYEANKLSYASEPLSRLGIRIRSDFELRNFKIEDAMGNSIDECFSGQSIRFLIEYRNLNGTRREVVVGVSVHNASNQFVTVFNNKMRGVRIISNREDGAVECTVNRFPLMSGLFFIGLIVQVDGKLIYELRDIASIRVNEADYFESGFSNALGRQGVLIDHSWKCI